MSPCVVRSRITTSIRKRRRLWWRMLRQFVAPIIWSRRIRFGTPPIHKTDHLLLHVRPRASFWITGDGVHQLSRRIEVYRWQFLNLQLRHDKVSEWIVKMLVVGNDNVGKHHGFLRKERALVQFVEFLLQFPTGLADGARKFENDELVGVVPLKLMEMLFT